MELGSSEAKGYPRLIFIQRRTGLSSCAGPTCRLDPNLKEDLPLSGWEQKNFTWLKVWFHPDVPDVICEMGPQVGYEQDILRMRLSLQPIYQKAQDSGGLPFHAALIEKEGMGILLAAPADTGKSTCCRRIPSPWYVLCDEETLIVNNGQKQNRFVATWSEHFLRRSELSWGVQKCLPISAIFFLEQAETDEVVPIGKGQAAVLVYQSAAQVCYRNWVNLSLGEMRNFKKKLFENACALTLKVPAFKLRVSLKGRFWEQMEKVLF
jgi:SynChlorMet cassette protein ScmC